ncbi:MAG: hypothetical protein KDI09_22350, partial [Halioglobus sp.]|nr:hypothetical protein [Halioglobus sp.]
MDHLPHYSCRLIARIVVACIVLLPGVAAAQSLTYGIEGLDGELARNVRAWLGPEPETPAERQNFVASARERSASALQALGYYRPDIDISVDRSASRWTMRIAVTPGEPVRLREIDLNVSGEATTDEAFAELLASPGFAGGDVLHHGKFERFRSELLSLAQKRGYFDARIASSRITVDADAGAADVRVLLESGERFAFGEFEYDQTL